MRALAVFARAPDAGRVKTRLSPALPPGLAASLYAALLADAFEAAAGVAAEWRGVFWADGPGTAPPGWHSCTQQGTDLGQRLTHAFAQLVSGDVTSALVLGTDTPGLATAAIERAFALLERHDAVVGPASDGGYWAIGLRAAAPALFRDIPWSTPAVLESTLARAREAGLSMACADTLADLDIPADLARLLGACAADAAVPGPHTRTALRAMGLLPPWLSVPRRSPAAGASR